jgi:hypothetical protein
MRITLVRKGDTIIDGQDKIKVDKIEHGACSSFGTHVNNRFCYDRFTQVQVREGKRAKPRDFEEDLEEEEEDWAV